jgi:hypothetical protein
MKNYKLLFVFVSVLIFVGLSAVSCQRGPGLEDPIVNDDSNPIDDPTDPSDLNPPILTPPSSGLPDPSLIRQQVINERFDADAAVQALQPDVILQLVSTKFINSLSSQTGLATNYYIYSSSSNTDFYYLANVPRNGESLKRFLMPKEDLDLPFDLVNVPLDAWKLTYADALQKAEERGGSDFRARHTTFEVSVILAKPAGDILSWFITYRATDSTADMLKIAVDANNGATIVIQ